MKNKQIKPIIIVLPKGRIASEAIDMFQKVFDLEIVFKGRELIATSKNFKFLLVRNQDVVNYVKYQAADLGILGLDVLREQESKLVELIDLQIGKCKISIGIPKDKKLSDIYNKPTVKVATKMTNIAKKYFSQKSISVEIIKLYGSIELAPIVGLSDIIVDLVESGDTMRENGLIEESVIFHSSAQLVANVNSYYSKKEIILDIYEKLHNFLHNK